MTSDQSWKEKYLQELESAEQRKKQWEAEKHALQRMLVRTSLASEGQTEELDRLLNEVRKDLRKDRLDIAKWRALQDQMDRQIALLDDPATALPESTPQQGAVGDENDLGNNQQRLRIARRVGQLVGQLLQQVTLEPVAEAQARQLQQSLLKSDDWEELRDGLNSVAELVIAAVTRGQRDFESFLKRLDERLQSLRQHFQDQSFAQAGRLDASGELDREIQQELEQIGQQVQSSGDLSGLKQSVTRHLQSIGGAVRRFREQESEREESLSHQLEAVQEKLAAVEANSEKMQERIREERARALIDLLTQLPNREAWQERLAFEYNRWQRYRHPLTIAVLDIDLFKRVNDSYGHKAGDRVLQLVARELRERLRSTDFIARFGGEEFVLLLPETTCKDARGVLDKLRGCVAELPFHFRGERVTITFSAGLAEFRDGDTEDTVFDHADRALYAAKDGGRNQVRLAADSD